MTVTNLTPPTISGTAQQGQTLTSTPGTWSYDLAEINYAFQWLRCDAAGANCVPITGKTQSSLLLSAADVGHTVRLQVTATESAAPPPSAAYFDYDWSSGNIASPYSTVFSYTSPGYWSTPVTQSPDGRVKVVPNPDGPGNALRCEIRDSDPGWPIITNVQKAEVRTLPQNTWNQSQVNYGDVRWFSLEVYLPYNGTEKFEWAHGGGNAFLDIGPELHPGNNSWPAFGSTWYPETPQYYQFRLGGGTPVGSTANLQSYNLFQLTDGSGNRIMANHNRWVQIVIGAKFNYDFTGWVQAWVDGVQVLAQTNHPTMWQGDFSMYFKHGLYKQVNASFPETGRSVAYFGRAAIGYAKADVE